MKHMNHKKVKTQTIKKIYMKKENKHKLVLIIKHRLKPENQ